MAVKAYGKSVASYTDWAAETIYSLNDYVEPTVSSGKCYKCTTAGTSGLTEPTWNSTVDSTTDDSDVVWTCENYAEEPNPLSVELNTGGLGGYPFKDVWVKSDGNVTFLVEVSYTGEGGSWREIDSVNVNDTSKFNQYVTPYLLIKVSTETSATNEIEIVAGVG